MHYTSVEDVMGTDRDASGSGWRSRRLVLAKDGLPFSIHETTVAAGTELHLCYQRHSETVYCIEGRASVENLDEGKTYRVGPGTLYSVGIGDDHILRIEEDTRFLCIFEPALEGQEEAD